RCGRTRGAPRRVRCLRRRGRSTPCPRNGPPAPAGARPPAPAFPPGARFPTAGAAVAPRRAARLHRLRSPTITNRRVRGRYRWWALTSLHLQQSLPERLDLVAHLRRGLEFQVAGELHHLPFQLADTLVDLARRAQAGVVAGLLLGGLEGLAL